MCTLLCALGCPTPEPQTPPPASAIEAERPEIGWLEELAAGDTARVDTSRGVVFVVYTTDASGESPDADEAGLIRTARRACGEQLEQELARLGRDLEMRFEDASWASLMRCEGMACVMPAMGEYDLTGDLTFATVGDEVMLDSVVRIEGGPVTEELRAAGRAWADAELTRLAGGACP